MKIRELYLKNYRSFEDCTIQFEDYYTAICGKNNSGKSNILRAVLNTLERSRHYDRFNYSSDYPVWKSNKKDEKIAICLKVHLDKLADSGLIKFIEFFLSDSKQNEEINLEDKLIEIHISLGNKKAESKILLNGIAIEDKYKVGEILRRIHFAPVVSFHNSTQHSRTYRRSSHGYLDSLPTKSKEIVETKLKQVNKELSKALEKHKSELQSLIGRLQDKYEVGLTFSGIDLDFDRIPYEISLGEKNFELPLEDWGSGTKNRTLILSSIFEAKNQIDLEDETNRITPIVIIEEPESFLHPSAQAEFGRVLQDLSQELKIQVIATTHSPYLLSHHNPKSNILLKRKISRKKIRESYIESIDETNWREPFELALGMIGPEFESLKEAFFSKENSILLVEGALDVEYFKLLQDSRHGENKLNFNGELYPYGGFGFLNNPVLLKFMKERFSNLYVTLDLDVYSNVKSNFEKAGYVKDKDYFLIGLDKPGFRFIEGLIPNSIREKVNAANSGLVFALQSEKKEERKSAKDRLKDLYLKEFKKEPNYDESHFSEFYKLVKKMNKKMKNAT